MVSNRSRVVLVTAALTLPALALGGCGSSSKGSAPTTSPSTAPSPTTGAASPTTGGSSSTTVGGSSTTTAVKTPPLPKNFPNSKAARQNVDLSSCVTAPGGWSASGTAHDPSASAGKYKITVYFTDSKATTIGYGQTEVSVQPGKSATWKVADKFNAPSKVLCVLVGVGDA
jgi:hypothetical protein